MVALHRVIALFIVLGVGLVSFAQTPQPTLVPIVPVDETNADLQNVADDINTLPDNLNQPARVGVDPNVSVLFGYIKWFLSTDTAYELLGETLGPIGAEIIVILNMVLVLTVTWITVNMIVYTIKFIVWAYYQTMKAIEVLAAIVEMFTP